MTEVTKDRIREIGSLFRGFGEYARDNYFTEEIEIEEGDYYFDLGQFGDQSAEVSLKEDKEFDPDEILSTHFPLDTGTILDLAEELENYEVEDQEDPTLDKVLTLMENDGQGALVKALRAVVEAFQGVVLKASDMGGLSLGPLPPKPMPWPGAMRPEIDYTAADFPLRYQPPPGFDWAGSGGVGSRRAYSEAVLVPAPGVKGSDMVLDGAGRVYWGRSDKQDSRDTFSYGSRWVLWHLDRDGIPEGAGFSGGTPPRAFDMDGNIILGAVDNENVDFFTDEYLWGSAAKGGVARVRVREIREQFEAAPASPSKLSYDPLTVEVSLIEDGVPTRELRLGDDIVGDDYGRVVSVEYVSVDRVRITMDRNGYINTEEDSVDASWSVLPICGVNLNRGAEPTALELSGGAPQANPESYEPLTIPLKDEKLLVLSGDLRLGDDIQGTTFGRVVGIEGDKIVMNRDGIVNRTRFENGFKWEVRPIDVPDRDSIPTAASLELAF